MDFHAFVRADAPKVCHRGFETGSWVRGKKAWTVRPGVTLGNLTLKIDGPHVKGGPGHVLGQRSQ